MKTWLKWGALFIGGSFLSGCASVQYYMQAANGHYDLVNESQSIETLIEAPDTDPKLREILRHSQEARDFASHELGLPDNDSYRYYAGLERDYAVWNVVATEEFSVDPVQWCFPFVGCISYKGYFDQEDARRFAAKLKAEGHDVSVSGARAYSTIGWFDDPLISSMLYQNEATRVGIMFHELAHQQVYIQDDSAFNEAFAMTVEIEGVKRWLKQQNQPGQLEAYRETLKRKQAFNALLKATRERLDAVYAQSGSPDQKRLRKQAVFEDLRQEYIRIKASWGGYDGYDRWMAQGLNNAHLSLAATYYNLIPAFQGLLKSQDHDLQAFYQEAGRLGERSKEERLAILKRHGEQRISLWGEFPLGAEVKGEAEGGATLP